MSYSSITIANYFLELAEKESRALTPLQLMKLVYLAHGFHLGAGLGALISDDPPVALNFGPTHLRLYRKIHDFRAHGVKGPLGRPLSAFGERLQGQSLELVNQVWNNFSRWSGMELSQLCNHKGSVWDEVMRPDQKLIISDEAIIRYFHERMTAPRAKPQLHLVRPPKKDA